MTSIKYTLSILTVLTLSGFILFGLQTQAKAQSVSSPLAIQPNSSLIPEGINADDKFRLIFITSTKHAADSADINTYNTIVQTAAENNQAFKDSNIDSNTIANIKAVGSTSTNDARDNTDMWDSTAQKWKDANDNVPIYWVGGGKIADSYSDFYDGSWKLLQRNLPRDESGTHPSTGQIAVWTGSNDDGTKHSTNPLGATQVLWGAVGLVTGMGINPIGNTNTSNTDTNTTPHHIYGISPVLQVGKTGILFDTSFGNDVGEGDDKKVTLNLTAPAQENITITVNTADGTASASTDYTAGPYQIQFAKGEQSKTFTIPTTSDNINEGVEVFGLSIQTDNFPDWLNLQSNDGALVYIWEKVELTIAPTGGATEVEENELAQFTITANQSSDLDLTVIYRVTDGPGHGYIDSSERGTFTTTIPAGETTAIVGATARGDTIDMPGTTGNGQITVTLEPHYNGVYTLGTTKSISLPIYDSEVTWIEIHPAIGGDPSHLVEGGIYQFNTSLRRELLAPERLAISFANTGTAAYGTDYKLLCPTFKNLKNMGVICSDFDGSSPSITLIGGASVENTDEIIIEMHDFLQVLTDATSETTPETITITPHIDATSTTDMHGGAVSISSFSSTIHDPPATATVQFSQNAFAIKEGSNGLLEAAVTLSTPLGSDLALPITIAEQSATRGTDFLIEENGILVKAGETATSFSIDIPDDNLPEANKQFTITIDADSLPSSPTSVTTGTNTTAAITIIDDEPLQITLDASRKIVYEGGESSNITVTLNRPLQTGEELTVPLRIRGAATRATDYTLTEQAAAGVTYTKPDLSTVNVSFAPPNQAATATLVLNGLNDSTQETVSENIEIEMDIDSTLFTKAHEENLDPIHTGSPLTIYLLDPHENSQSVTITGQGITSGQQDLYIAEGDSGDLLISLNPAPTGNVTAQATVISGSNHASISTGNSLTFTPTDYSEKKISILGTEDTAVDELDTVVVRITLTSSDAQYNNKTYEKIVKIVDNDTPIVISFTEPTSIKTSESGGIFKVYFTSNQRTPKHIPSEAFSLTLTDIVGDFIAKRSDSVNTDSYSFEWSTSSIEIGENSGYLNIDMKDDDVVEQDATATATLSLEDAFGTVSPDHNTLHFTHTDDDQTSFEVEKSGDVYYLSTKKNRSFPIQIEYKVKSGFTPPPDTLRGQQKKIELPQGFHNFESITLRTQDDLYFTQKWYEISPADVDIIVITPKQDNVVANVPTVSITAGSDVIEGSDAVFTVTSTPAQQTDLDVDVTIAQTGDYGVTPGKRTVTIPANSNSVQLTIRTTGDAVDEADGTVTATVVTKNDYTISSTQGIATIAIEDDEVPEIRIAAGNDVTEGDNAVFTLTSTPTPHAPLTVDVAITKTGDYGVTPGTQTVTMPITGTAMLTIPTTGDTTDEPDGTVTATVVSKSGYTISSTHGTATIAVEDDDVVANVPTVSITAGSDVIEGGDAVFTIASSSAPQTDLDVDVTIAQTGDYGVTPGKQTVTILANSNSVQLTVGTTGDAVDEADGTVTATLETKSTYTIAGAQGIATIAVEDDEVPEIRIAAGSDVTEGDNAVFTLTSVPAPHAPLTVDVIVAQTGDYGVTPGKQTVTMPTTGTVTLTIPTTGDAVDEASGTITATVVSKSGYTISNTQGTASITVEDNDVVANTPTVSIAAGSDVIEGGDVIFTLTSTPVPQTSLEVDVTIAQTGDYGVTPGKRTVTIPIAGTATLTIPTTEDTVDEADGAVTATLEAKAIYNISSTHGTASITVEDNDTPEIRIAANGDVTEGDNAVFTLTSVPAPHAPLNVDVIVAQTGDYGVTPGTQTVTMPTTGTTTLTIPTTGDVVNEEDGAITATVVSKSDYAVSNTRGTASVTVEDDDVIGGIPTVSITAGSDVIEGSDAVFTVTSTPAQQTDLDVDVTIAQTGDYGVTPGKRTVTIPANSNSVQLTIRTTGDAVDEADGTVTATVVTKNDYTISSTQGIATIAIEDDEVPEIRIAAGNDVTEGDNAVFTLTSTPTPHAPLTVDVAITKTGDYGVTPGTQTVTMPITGTAMLTIPTTGDAVDEVDGTVTATVVSKSGYTISSTQGTATIAVEDDDVVANVPTVSITAGSDVIEGSDAVFTVTSTPAQQTDLDVDVTIAQTGDYGVTPGKRTVTIPANSNSVQLTIRTTGDAVDEADGTVTATVVTKNDYTISSTQGIATIAIEDDEVPEIRIAAGNDVTEGDNAVFTLTSTPTPHAPLTVDVAITKTGDYGVTPGTQTVTMPITGTAMLTIPTTGDTTDEPDGTVTATVVSKSGYTISSTHGTATIAVEDDDVVANVPTVSITAGSDVIEGGDAVFTIASSSAPQTDLDVDVTIAQTGDYGVTPGKQTVTILANSNSVQLTVGTTGDAVDEADGTVTATLETKSTYTIAGAQGIATIAVEDDEVPEIRIASSGDVTEGNNAVFTLTSVPAPHAPLTVDVIVAQTGDYGVTPGKQTVTMPTTGTVTLTIPTTGDTTDEPNGAVTATVVSKSGYTISSTHGTASITVEDNDDNDVSACNNPSRTAFWRSLPRASSLTCGTTQTATCSTGRDSCGNPISCNGSAPSIAGTYCTSGVCSNGSCVIPQVSITAENGIIEGESTTFTITSTPAPTTNLKVDISITQTGDYGITPENKIITIPTSGAATLTISTTNDDTDESDGSVTVTLSPGNNYTISSTHNTKTVTISDDDAAPTEERISLSLISITKNSVTAVWSKLPNTDQYVIKWWKTGSKNSRVHYQFIDTNYKKIDGLRSGTAYTVEVIPKIDSIWQETQKSAPVSFSTLTR